MVVLGWKLDLIILEFFYNLWVYDSFLFLWVELHQFQLWWLCGTCRNSWVDTAAGGHRCDQPSPTRCGFKSWVLFAFWTGVCRVRLITGLNTWRVLQPAERRDVEETGYSFAGLFIRARSGYGDARISVSLKLITRWKPPQSLSS